MEGSIRRCADEERDAVRAIIEAGAERYRGAIPADCWHEPYMSRGDLDREIAAGVEFWGFEAEGELVGVMGVQPVRDVVLIRHAYVRPEHQGKGIGGRLLDHLRARAGAPILIGTWAAAVWAIGFYQRNGFRLVEPPDVPALLRRYWTISDRQIETSVVLVESPAA
jgi:GNAT superfamily N-acetyltransferase